MVSSISVIIPPFNAEATLPAQLEALAGQTFTGAFDVIVADNASTDRTRTESKPDFEPEAVDAYGHTRSRGEGIRWPGFRTIVASCVRLLLKLPWLFSEKKRPSAVRSWAKRCGRFVGSVRERVLNL